MLANRNPVEVLTTLRTAQPLLAEEPERHRKGAVVQADHGTRGPTARCRELLETAEDLGTLAAEIAAVAEGRASRRCINPAPAASVLAGEKPSGGPA